MHTSRALIWVALVFLSADGVLSLSAKGKAALKKMLKNVDLEERRMRLRNLKAGKSIITYNNSTITGKSGINATDEVVDSTPELGLTPSNSSILGINKKEGVDEYLYEGDINLTEEQLSELEAAAATYPSRRKRQAQKSASKWTNKELFYYFDPSISPEMQTTVTTALNYIQGRTCLKFTVNATAPNRVALFDGGGCYSYVGMVGGEQQLSLASGCNLVGIVSHEFMHALGIVHMQSRSTRDSFLKVDLTNVPANMQHNYDKLPATDEIVYTPYEYGSVMHYDAQSFATSGNSMIALDAKYMRTMGSDMVSFYDLQEINKHYLCTGICATGAACVNGGMRNPKNCGVCICPSGYGGATCATRQAGCGAALVAKATWTSRTFSVPTNQGTTQLTNPVKCNDMISAPAGKKIQIRVTAMQNVICMNGCIYHAIEPKVVANKMMTSPRICCPGQLNTILTSGISPTPVVGHSLYTAPVFTYQYRYV
ncbi:hypothetical protein Q1695_005664 [Nippostrongylus brasiliensis]|nr:hypothetical protein Q1695_005664 [Nippostrongylus brasiliensis]